MKATPQKIIMSGVLAIGAVMLGLAVAWLFFGLSREQMLTGQAAAFAALLGICMLGNRLTYGVWIKRPTEQERVVLDAGLKRAQFGYLVGSLALLPLAFLMIMLGFDSNIAMSLTILAGVSVAAFLFMRHRQASLGGHAGTDAGQP